MTPHPIFSLDAETDGLYGEVWAIGACIINADGTTGPVFGGQLDPAVVTDPWVRENVVPVVDLRRYPDRDTLLRAFWDFWMQRPADALCVADFGAPVEAGLFRACVEQDPARTWLGPYPMHELGTALLLAGIDPDMDRRSLSQRRDLRPHNPLEDAVASGLCWRIATAGSR